MAQGPYSGRAQTAQPIEGFRLYLSVAEEDEIKLSGAPRFSSDIYQSFLPYALALGVDHAWSEKLERSIAAAWCRRFPAAGFLYYHASHTYSGFADSLSSNLDSAISSASTAPGSSSGSSGGSSGGGGGGGGGGGW